MITGLTIDEVNKKKSLGLSNQIIDTYTPSGPKIIIRNVFNLINLVLIPLLITLLYFRLYSEVLAFSTFAILNTIVSIYDEFRIKKKLDKLKSQFQQRATVIREGKEYELPVNEIVERDYVKAKQGDGIIADGEIVYSNYLQVDESALTGESNYIQKDIKEKVLAGSYVVTGECIYTVESVGKNNYLNRIGSEALKYAEKKSDLQRKGDQLILFLVIASIALAFANFYVTGLTNTPIETRILSLTTIIVLIIPQTLIFLFTLTFTVSITKLYNQGILIQKGGSIEELSNINVICFDKTGTITTNNMFIVDVKKFNLDEEKLGEFYNSVKEKIVSVNKTQSLLNEYFSKYKTLEVNDFDQIPFTSKLKYSLVTGAVEDKLHTLIFGAFTILKDNIKSDVRSEIESYVNSEEQKGNRVLVGLYFDDRKSNKLTDSLITDKVIIFSIEEELNPGIQKILDDLTVQNISVKIISGDSLNSVVKILQKIGIDSSKAVDLSTTELGIEELALEKSVFTRAKPEDKLDIINALKKQGFKVAMVGDGINDVLSIKAADVSISMEGGSKIARDIADIVLLKNDFSKIPQIFFEGENIIFNLKLSAKLFLLKSFVAILTGIYFTIIKLPLPIHPSSTLIFSFLGSSSPSYVVVFTRQKINNTVSFFKDIFSNTILQSLIITAAITILYTNLRQNSLNSTQINTSIIMFLLMISVLYSLHQIWISNKLKNIFLGAVIFIVLVTIGIFQTILPITQYNTDIERILIVGFVLLGSLIVFSLLWFLNKSKRTFKNVLLMFVISIIWVPVVLYFPFASYYHVTRLSVDIFRTIGLYAALTFVIVLITTNLINKRIKNA